MRDNIDGAAPPSVPPKEALCYQCALRMSIMFQMAPPQSLNQLISSAEFKEECKRLDPTDPVRDDRHHARFTVVYETVMSVQRYLDSERPAPAFFSEAADAGATGSAPRANEAKGNSCIDGMFGGENAPRHDCTWLCVACFGLYQFMDLVHAPSIAADVRTSPYADSTAISVNVNVNRSFTFTWLAAATRYVDRTGTMTARPSPAAVIPEEMSNFKEFYMSDLRARVLQYLLRPHADVVAATQASRPATVTPGIATYLRAITRHARSSDIDGSAEPAKKHARVEGQMTKEPEPICSQGFTYRPDGGQLVCEVYCRHHATEELLLRELVPPQYCRNKSGCVLSYSVIYDYVEPFLKSTGWAAPIGCDTRLQKRGAATVSCGVAHANIYLVGNYRKMMRNLSQSPWFTNGARVGSFSLQEVIANPVLPFFFPEGVTTRRAATPGLARETTSLSIDGSGGVTSTGVAEGQAEGERSAASGAPSPRTCQLEDPNLTSAEQVFGHGCYKFHSAGREDVDVRMLGTGRPFVLEIVNPTREQFSEADLRTLEKAINESHNGSVEVFHMRLTDPMITVRLARHSESKIKRYRCVIWCSRPIVDPAQDKAVQRVNNTTDLAIEQKTPLRVLHRRSLHTRPRTIHSMRLTPLNAHWFLLDVETQAGTYVKEFVHGDMGRTLPNLGLPLNARTDIVQLDVVGMAMQDLDKVHEPAAAAITIDNVPDSK